MQHPDSLPPINSTEALETHRLRLWHGRLGQLWWPTRVVLAACAQSRRTFQPRAKRVIFLFMNGGMSQVDTFDPKPMLDKYDGQPLPGGNLRTERKTGNLMKSPFQFRAARTERH